MKFNIKEILFRILFIHPWYMHSRIYIFDLKFTIKGCVIMKLGHGCKILDWSVILHYFAEYLTCMLAFRLRSYRNSNLVLIWKCGKILSQISQCAAQDLSFEQQHQERGWCTFGGFWIMEERCCSLWSTRSRGLKDKRRLTRLNINSGDPRFDSTESLVQDLSL